MRRVVAVLGLGLAVLLGSALLRAQTPPSEFRPLKTRVEAFIAYMAQTHGFDAQQLRRLLGQVKPSQGVQKAIAAPSTAKPWYEFRNLFVDAGRVENGVRFWDANADTLARARSEFGVPEAIIVAIIGVETRYGRQTGGFRTVDALYTLAFDSQNRPDFFRAELEQRLLLAREQDWDPATIKGSYAGALGMPQFMPSSYRRYAIDYDGDGKIDLWKDPADVIGSVASYLRQFGWRDGEPVVAPVRVDSSDLEALLALGLKPALTVDQWRMRGIETVATVAPALNGSLFRLDLADGPGFWLGFDNFHAILQYNRSRNYAMAVYELAQQIAQQRQRVLLGEGSEPEQSEPPPFAGVD